MPPTRSFIICHKCGNNCMGRYKDDHDNPLCYACREGKRNKTTTCKTCGTGHYCTKSNDYCFTCWNKEHQKDIRGVKRCEGCGGSMKSKIDTIMCCIQCIGKQEYDRLFRAHKKAQVD